MDESALTGIAAVALAVLVVVLLAVLRRARKRRAIAPPAAQPRPPRDEQKAKPQAAAPETTSRDGPPGQAGPEVAEARTKPKETEAAERDGPDAAEERDEQPRPAGESSAAAQPTTAAAVERVSEPDGRDDLTVLREGLARTRGGFISRLAKLFQGKRPVDAALLEEIEEVLITADIGVKTTSKILDNLRTQMEGGQLADEEAVWTALRGKALQILSSAQGPMHLEGKPAVIIVVGVNGVGKTTTIGKLASRFQKQGKKVLLAAGDTFRAAAVLQLEVWGRRVGCPVVKGKENADPASVVFEAIKRAQEEGFDLVIADTAGRLHTKVPLMEELKKVGRTASKALDGRPVDEILLVLDSTIGQNAVQQAQIFKDALPVSGIVLTKLDGTAKGGVVLGVIDEYQLPVRFVGLGERVEDLREFEAEGFAEALFARPDDGTLAA